MDLSHLDVSQLNWLAIVVATVVGFFVGGLWYSPLMFAKAWMEGFGITEEQTKKANMPRTFAFGLLAAFVIAATLAMFIGRRADLHYGLFYGAHVGFLMVAPAIGIHYLFEQRSIKLWLINAGYVGVMFTIMGAILGAWH